MPPHAIRDPLPGHRTRGLLDLGRAGFDFALRWYALAYIAGIVIGWRIIVAAVQRPALWPGDRAPMTPEQVEEFLTWAVLGIVAGGRLGYALFYQPGYYLANPVEILYVWQGGMSFHGGFLGVVVAALWFCRRNGIPVRAAVGRAGHRGAVRDHAGAARELRERGAVGAAHGPALGRDLPGRAGAGLPRRSRALRAAPSQLYEAGLEGLLLGAILLWLAFGRGG